MAGVVLGSTEKMVGLLKQIEHMFLQSLNPKSLACLWLHDG